MRTPEFLIPGLSLFLDQSNSFGLAGSGRSVRDHPSAPGTPSLVFLRQTCFLTYGYFQTEIKNLFCGRLPIKSSHLRVSSELFIVNQMSFSLPNSVWIGQLRPNRNIPVITGKSGPGEFFIKKSPGKRDGQGKRQNTAKKRIFAPSEVFKAVCPQPRKSTR
mgnify:CR=1 FL=1